MNTLRITMFALLALVESAMGDMPLTERISIARFAKLEGVKVDFKEEGQGAVDVLLGNLFEIGKRKPGPEPAGAPETKDKTEEGNEAAPRSR